MLHIGDQPFLLMSQGDMAWSRGPKQEQAIIAAMRVQWRDAGRSAQPGGGRIVDRYSLDGAPLAIDAAAACAAGTGKSLIFHYIGARLP